MENLGRHALLERVCAQLGMRVGLILEPPSRPHHIAYTTREHGRVTHLEIRQAAAGARWRDRELVLRLGLDGELDVALAAAIDFALDHLVTHYGEQAA